MLRAAMQLFALTVLLVASATATLNPQGTKCGQTRCSTVEYCSPLDYTCKSCSKICDPGSKFEPDKCVSDCQEFLHDNRYVLLTQFEGEIAKLWTLVAIAIAVALLALLSTLYLIARKSARWKKMRAALRRAFARSKIKGTRTGNTGNANNINNNNHQKAQEDVELGTSKHNGLKLTMPTISASVAPSRPPENGSSHGSGSGSGSGSGTGISDTTPKTTTTTLSKRHPSEDTTLDYAYDNPAMTPSPESAQMRTKRESSF